MVLEELDDKLFQGGRSNSEFGQLEIAILPCSDLSEFRMFNDTGLGIIPIAIQGRLSNTDPLPADQRNTVSGRGITLRLAINIRCPEPLIFSRGAFIWERSLSHDPHPVSQRRAVPRG